jgi:hypothetical protein
LRGAGQEELRPKSGREDILLYFFQSGYICRLVERRKRKNKKGEKKKNIFFFFSPTRSRRGSFLLTVTCDYYPHYGYIHS